jgi:ABC-2 type transport system ATP-binding protein
MSVSLSIELRGLGKTFPRSWRRPPVKAVSDLNLQVAPGEAFGFIGPNGAGKSTTIKVLTGAIRATEGRAFINGKDCSRPQARQGVGYVPESPYLNDYLTPFEVLSQGLSLHGVRVDDPAAHCMHWLERFGLGAAARRMIRTFSKGMTQRTALAHAMAIKPSILILDEPLSGLDPIGRREVVDILADYRKQGGTLFFSSHVLHDVEHLADRYGLIHEGRLRAVSSPAELLGEDDRVTIRSQGGVSIEGQVSEPGGRWTLECPRAQLWQVLDALREAGQSVLDIRPRLSLEAAFMRTVTGAA